MSRQDRLVSLLETAFAALDEGDLDAVATKLEQARRIDPRHVGVLQLTADLEAAGGEPERAIELYEKLLAVAPDDPMPHLSIAEVALYSLGDAERALAAVDTAIERLERLAAAAEDDADAADDADAILHAQLTRATALIVLERLDEAQKALKEIPVGVAEEPALALQFAGTCFDAGDLARAAAWLEPLLRDADVGADAWHLLGCIHEAADDRAKMIHAWQETRKRDAAEPDAPWHLPVDELEAIAQHAFEELPPQIRERLAHVPILIEALPSEDMVADGIDPRLLGLFQGPAMGEDGTAGGGAPALTNIHLFQTNLERITDDPEELAEQIRITVLHETAHFFGLEDEDLEQLGLG